MTTTKSPGDGLGRQGSECTDLDRQCTPTVTADDIRREIERLRLALAVLAAQRAELLRACQCCYAAARRGDPHPLVWICDTLRAAGLEPPEGMTPAQIAATPLRRAA